MNARQEFLTRYPTLDNLANQDDMPVGRECAALRLTFFGLVSGLDVVRGLHSRRDRTVDGAGLSWCVECQQDWPCATIRQLDGAMGT